MKSKTADQRSWSKRVTYDITRILARLAGVAWFQIRCEGREHLPDDGGGLICSNHQSYLDPVLVGLASDRRLNYLARESLFDSAWLGWLIRWYDAIPIQRDGFGLGGIKETLKRLRRNELVLIFPEGTRTEDGEIGPLKPGICSLARRGKMPLVPVAIEGAYQAWPRGNKLPGRSRIWIQFGPAISASEVQELTDEQLLERLRTRMVDCFDQARQGLRAASTK